MTATSEISAEDRQRHEELLRQMKPGTSFFLQDVLPKHCGYLRRLAYKLGIRLSIRYVDQDEIYGHAGTRVMRLEDAKVQHP